MKKSKIYEISIIDKTYSKTISDETKFYTSDTALELGFELKEIEYTFESAEIVLLNVDDRSLVTRQVAKNLDSFTYELEDDIIAHYGEWRGQLRFEQAGEIYVSSPFKFRIENDLSDDRPPQLSDVQSWVSLKQYADSLIEELKQAVLGVEGIEDTFNENETNRQSQFETAEQSRQMTFNTNEDIRQTQELEREKAETSRQSEFEDNEASRFETFNTNEDTRQENETVRQQAESQRQSIFETNETERQTTFETAEQERQSAEVIRVENENQRKIDHANRSSELDGKADKVVLENLVENGDFSTNDISSNFFISPNLQESATINDGKLVLKPKTFTWSNNIRIDFQQNIGEKIYCRFTINSPITTKVDWRVGGTSRVTPYGPGESTISFINTVSSVNNYMYLYTQDFTEDMVIKLDNIEAINLTDTFGVGNEPTKEEMDELIKVTGYIDGEYALNNKEMLIWTLALIRRNKNAIVALGGA